MRTLAPRILVLAALFSLLGSRDLPGQVAGLEPPAVAVMDFSGFLLGESGNSGPLGKAVSAMLVTELSGREGFRVIERQELQTLLMEQRLSLSGRVDEATAVQVGRMVGARYVILGAASSTGETTRIDMRIVDVETSEIPEVRKLSDRTEELFSMVVQIADLFSEQLDLPVPPGPSEPEVIPVQATLAFSLGVDFEDKGETAKAIEHYREVLRIAPNHQGARKALDRLTHGGGGVR